MTHIRQQIRDAAVILATGLTTTGARVFDTRLYPLAQADCPAWVVTTDQKEDVVALDIGDRLDRTFELAFSGYARATLDVQDTLDTMAEELETVIQRAAFAGLLKECRLESTEFEMTGENVDAQMGVIILTYHVRYVTARAVPGVAI